MLRSDYPEIRVTASWAAEEGGDLPDIHHLVSADLLVIFARRMTPLQAQMAYVRNHVDAAKPVVGIRTASVAFENFGLQDPVAWINRFGDERQGRAFYTSLDHPHDFEDGDLTIM